MKNLATILLLIMAVIVVILILLQPEISSRAGKTVVKTSAAIFFIPSLRPIKIFSLSPKSEKLNQIIREDTQNIDSTFGIYIKNLNTKEQTALNENESFKSASLYKLFVMYTIFDKGTRGELNLSQEDIQDNLEAMITVSSNEAAIYLVQTYTSWQEVTDKMRAIGLTNTDLSQDTPVTSPADVGKLLELIADGKAVNFDSSVKMLSLMSRQTRRDRIPADLPSEAVVANKTGELDDVLHDAAVVGTDQSDYVIVLMTKESADLALTRRAMQKISADVYNYFNNQWATVPEIL